MQRFLASALIVGLTTIGLVGCEEKTEVKKTTEINTPDGTKKITDKQTTESTGDQKVTEPK